MTQRNYVVTGSASGIGAAVKRLLEEQGHRVIGVDLHDADVNADLSNPAGRETMLAGVRDALGDARLHGVVASAGVSWPKPITVSINYFGAVATLEGLRPLMLENEARAVAVASMVVLQPNNPEIVEACLRGDETAALTAAEAMPDEHGYASYPSSKRALARWIRREAPKPEWAGKGIPLNAVAPGVVLTAMTEELLASEEGRQQVAQSVPMPLGGYASADDIAWPILWLLSPENRKVTGQLIFVDAGTDTVMRGNDIW